MSEEMQSVTAIFERQEMVEKAVTVRVGEEYEFGEYIAQVLGVGLKDGGPVARLQVRRPSDGLVLTNAMWAVQEMVNRGLTRIKKEPPPLPEGLENGRCWKAKEEGVRDRVIYGVRWDEEREEHIAWFWAGGNMTLADLIADYTMVPWRPHDMSDPYCGDKLYNRCKACGSAVQRSEEMPTDVYCTPVPNWRKAHEKELAENTRWEQEESPSIGWALDREIWTPPQSAQQSFHLRTGGVFTLAPGQRVREIGKPHRPWLFDQER